MAMESVARARVESYLKNRPNYPRKLIDFLYNDCGFSWESVIADIGSGTGVFTRLLLEKGSRVVAIEPNREMRETAERILCDEFPRFVSLCATAENTTLSDASIHHIVCAQSFHRFDMKRCKEEFKRILKPGGSIVLIWNRRIIEADDFSSEYEALIKRYSKDYDKGNDRKFTESDYADFFGSASYSVLSLPNQQSLDLEGLKGRMLSGSYIPAHGEEGHIQLMEELEILFELYNEAGKVTMKYETEAYAWNLNRAG